MRGRTQQFESWYALCFEREHALLHPSETDPVKSDTATFPFSLSKNLGSPVAGEIFNFTRTVCGFSSARFTYPARIVCVRLKKANKPPDRKGQPRGEFADPVTFVSENPVRIQMSLGLLQTGVFFFDPKKKKRKGVFSKSYDAASMRK